MVLQVEPRSRHKRAVGRQEVTDDLSLLLQVLPPKLRVVLENEAQLGNLIEVIMDLGRQPEARFFDRALYLNHSGIVREDLDYVIARVGDFTADNRAGMERTLHRISAIRNRRRDIIGLTCRVGRAVTGTVEIIRDVVEKGSSLLLLGPPGVGKTTLLREAARVLAEELEKRVVVVDTSNEIAGDGDIPHSGIGCARRMQVPSPELQHQVMIEAVENHMPEVIVIDEIGTLAEALAARTIAERGVQLVATAHGITLQNLLINPTLSDLVGGIQAVTLSDEEARRRGTQKTVLERKAPPTFDILVEIQSRERLAVYPDIAQVVDRLLSGAPVRPELRVRDERGRVKIEQPQTEEEPGPEFHRFAQQMSGIWENTQARSDPDQPQTRKRTASRPGLRRLQLVYPIGVSRSRLERSIEELRVPARLVEDPERADLILSLTAQPKRQPKKVQQALDKGVQFHTIKSNTLAQVKRFLQEYFRDSPSAEPPYRSQPDFALQEAEDGIIRVQRTAEPVELSPQNAYLRRLQHELIQSHGLHSESRGRSPYRRVMVYPQKSLRPE